MKVAVIGAGTMGNGISHVFAQYGFKVNMIDVSADALKRATDTIGKNLDRMVTKGKLTAEQKDSTIANLSTFTSLEEGVKGCGLVVEAATENIDLKCKIFRDLDTFCDAKTILSTNTSSISITKIAAQTKRPDKIIGMHFMNPVPVMKLVEVIRGYATSDEVTKTVFDLSRKLEKIPVEVNDYPGFVANRIPMGPLQLADFIGLDVCLSIMRVLHDGFGNPKYAPCPLLVNMVMAGNLGVKSKNGFYEYTEGSKEAVVASKFRK
jgi:3-hydroxybutyryl-CoA dehydrogenase